MRLLVLAVAIALAAPVSAQTGQARMIGGSWTGVGYQVGPTGPQMSWTISLEVRAGVESRINYPSLGCKATLHELKRDGEEITFREQITEGACIDDGRITARFVDNRVFWFWSKPNAGADASAVLYRDTPIG